MRFVFNDSPGLLKNSSGEAIPVVQHYKYLGNDVLSARQDVASHISKAWIALRKFKGVWRSRVPDFVKRELFVSLVSPIFRAGLCSIEDSATLQRHINGSYHRMLRFALDVKFDFQTQRYTKPTEQLLGDNPFLSAQLGRSRAALIGHTLRAHAQRRTVHPVCDVILWDPTPVVEAEVRWPVQHPPKNHLSRCPRLYVGRIIRTHSQSHNMERRPLRLKSTKKRRRFCNSKDNKELDVTPKWCHEMTD